MLILPSIFHVTLSERLRYLRKFQTFEAYIKTHEKSFINYNYYFDVSRQIIMLFILILILSGGRSSSSSTNSNSTKNTTKILNNLLYNYNPTIRPSNYYYKYFNLSNNDYLLLTNISRS